MRDYKALIRQKRQEKGISQNQLAKLVGISQPYMNQIETGVRNPTLPTLMKICEILDISLFGKEDEETG
ncbi:helix-turn-helix transcriptional regulator [Flavonifractor sp. An10]|uniref:helix-turn-helix domain-containing protein n=1 Tax=Flavonifractor sp. An10 TaxID=1965537 RepID=UPI000B37E4D7|nr:helix-turn-helix transcriptional regulator [Flavonifractor sp. An10]OUQ82020.1 transcriptional regulator [Flavonifractor sp. An10]HJB71060.1 helix-turn-helix domain-containing protein [Candidatus Flavonifractor avistercoris]